MFFCIVVIIFQICHQYLQPGIGPFGFWKLCQNIALLVHLTALDDCFPTKCVSNSLVQRFPAVQDKQAALIRRKSSVKQIREESLDCFLIFRSACGESQHALTPIAFNHHSCDDCHFPNSHPIHHENWIIVFNPALKGLVHQCRQPFDKLSADLAFAGADGFDSIKALCTGIFPSAYPSQQFRQHSAAQ